jgi:hypothetical protein
MTSLTFLSLVTRFCLTFFFIKNFFFKTNFGGTVILVRFARGWFVWEVMHIKNVIKLCVISDIHYGHLNKRRLLKRKR